MAVLIVGAWLSGWVQQGSSGEQRWWSRATKWFRNQFFYKHVLPVVLGWVWKDCGELGYTVKYEAGSDELVNSLSKLMIHCSNFWGSVCNSLGWNT
jgi:hypothetical protein